MSVSLVDLKQAIGNGMNIRQIKLMIGHQTYEVFFEDFETPGKTVSLKKVWGFAIFLMVSMPSPP